MQSGARLAGEDILTGRRLGLSVSVALCDHDSEARVGILGQARR